MTSPHIYLDHNATTPLLDEVREAMARVGDGNPSSPHALGRQAKYLIESARSTIAKAIGAHEEALIFTSGASESNTAVLYGCLRQFDKASPPHLITSQIEHPSILETCRYLESLGVELTYLPVDTLCRVSPQAVQKAIKKNTKLVSIMMANNETGILQAIDEIATITNNAGILFHTDAVQSVGKEPINLDILPIDFLSFSSHKLYGPKGVGGLYIRNKDTLSPLFLGGHQEFGVRSGTENVAGIVGFEKAVSIVLSDLASEQTRLLDLKRHLQTRLSSEYPFIHYNGDQDNCLANTLNVSFGEISGEALMMSLDLEGIAISTGSACSTGALDPSHVLLAMGRSQKESLSAIRLSLGRFTTLENITAFFETLHPIITRLSQD